MEPMMMHLGFTKPIEKRNQFEVLQDVDGFEELEEITQELEDTVDGKTSATFHSPSDPPVSPIINVDLCVGWNDFFYNLFQVLS